MSSRKPPPPSQAQQDLAAAQADATRRYMDLSEQQFNQALDLAKVDSARADEQYQFQRGLQTEAANRDRFFFDRYKDTTLKFEDEFFKRVNDFNEGQAADKYAAEGIADVEQQTAAARGNLTRGLAARGVNVGSARAVGALGNLEYTAALGKASAANLAREAARREGLSLKAQAAGLGNPLGASSGYMDASAGFGEGAVRIGGQGFRNASGLFGGAMNAATGLGSAANQTFDSVNRQWNARANASVNWGQVLAQGLVHAGGVAAGVYTGGLMGPRPGRVAVGG